MSVYRTIGPLVICFVVAIFDLEHDVEAIFSLPSLLIASGNLF